MGEQQATSSAASKWGDALDLLSEERKQELAQCLWAWNPEKATDEQPGPFAGQRLNGLEVFWLAIRAQAGQEGDPAATEQTIRQPGFYDLSIPTLYLQEANLGSAQLQGASLEGVHLERADLRQASLDKKTLLNDVVFTDTRLDGVILDNTNISVVDWSLAPRLQDERLAHQKWYPKDYPEKDQRGKRKSRTTRGEEYQAAAGANRRLVVALQVNGMSEEAVGYAYRAQVMQRRVYRFSGWRSWGRWLFS